MENDGNVNKRLQTTKMRMMIKKHQQNNDSDNNYNNSKLMIITPTRLMPKPWHKTAPLETATAHQPHNKPWLLTPNTQTSVAIDISTKIAILDFKNHLT